MRPDAIWSNRVETIYTDVLQFLYHLSLGILIGGSLVLGAAVAPAIFRTVASRGEAGGIFGGVLARWDGLAILCVIVVVLTSVLKAGAFEASGGVETRLLVRWVALALVAAAVLYSSGWANPIARQVRAQTPRWDELPDGAPVRVEFAKLHRSSTRAMQIAILAGLVALFLS